MCIFLDFVARLATLVPFSSMNHRLPSAPENQTLPSLALLEPDRAVRRNRNRRRRHALGGSEPTLLRRRASRPSVATINHSPRMPTPQLRSVMVLKPRRAGPARG